MTPTLSLLRDDGPDAPLLIVGASLGTAVTPLWDACARALTGPVTVAGWDLPGHGRSAPDPGPFTVADLAESVWAATTALRQQNSHPTRYAGVSLGGTVGLQLALEHGDALAGAAIICSGARIGEPDAWHERADLVRRAGTPVMVSGSAQRWFAPGFLERDPGTGTTLLNGLQHTEKDSYAACCEALAGFDVRNRLSDITIPILAIAGEHDQVTPLPFAQEIAEGTGGRAELVPDAAHLAPAEQPATVAGLLTRFLTQEDA